MQVLDFSLNRLYAHSEHAATKLRVGVLVEDSRIPEYGKQVLEDIAGCNYAVITCRVDIQAENQSQSAPPDLATKAYLEFIDARYRIKGQPLDEESEAPIFSGVARIASSDIVTIQQLALDVLLYFGRTIRCSDYARFAKQGVWTLEIAGDAENVKLLALLTDVMTKKAETTARLVQYVPTNPPRHVLKEITFAPTPTPSISAHQFNVYWGAQHLFIQTLYELHQHGSVRFVGESSAQEEQQTSLTISGTDIAKWIAPLLITKTIRRYWEGHDEAHWKLAIRRSKQPFFSTPDAATVSSFTWIDPPKGHFWADPFPFVDKDGIPWLFFEDFSYEKQRAVISCGRLTEDNSLEDVRPVLERSYHLSYPHVFEHDGALWMIPETSESGYVELYRAVSTPYEWKLESQLMRLRCVDATPLLHDGVWWMFVSPSPVESHAPTTLLFSAESLTGKWTLHPSNPVCSDVRLARGAGRFFHDGSKLIRPSQNCSPTYGQALNFNEITNLSRTDYAEHLKHRICPEWVPGLRGLHTYNRSGEWEAIDGKIYLRPSER